MKDSLTYHTKTQEDFNALMKHLDGQGFLWVSGTQCSDASKKPIWEEYKDKTIVGAHNGNITYGSMNYLEDSETLIPFVAEPVLKEESVIFVPEFVDKWVKSFISSCGESDPVYDFVTTLQSGFVGGDICDWYTDNTRKFYNILLGSPYQVEKEPKYIVRLSDDVGLVKKPSTGEVFVSTAYGSGDGLVALTEKEIKEFDPGYWVGGFSNPAY